MFNNFPKIINYDNPVNESSPLNRKLLLWATALPQRATSNRVIDLCGKRHFSFAGGLQWGGNRPNGFRCLDARNSTAMTSTSFKPPTNAFTTGIWFKTTTVSCGLIGFNGASDASSGTYDRSIYLDASDKNNVEDYPDMVRYDQKSHSIYMDDPYDI